MKLINLQEFEELIKNSDEQNIIFRNFEISFNDSISLDLSSKSYEFKNCILKGERIDFYDFDESNENKHEFHTLAFTDCFIENDLFIKDCKLYQIVFQNVNVKSKNFFISSSEINRISISGNPEKYNSIDSLMIFELKGVLTHLDFRLTEINDTISISDCEFDSVQMNANKLSRFNIKRVTFKGDFDFWKNIILHYSSVRKSTFNNLNTKDTDFGKEIIFEKVEFSGGCSFEKIKNLLKTTMKFTNCNFDKNVNFDVGKVDMLDFKETYFKGIVSFQDVVCNKISIDKTHFEKVAFFNDFTINNIEKCNLKTIRIIKNQLIKTENKVDFSKYNSIEYNILLNQENLPFSEKFLLILNKKSNYFNTDWMLGIKFTLKISLAFFAVLLFVNSIIPNSDYPLIINSKSEFADVEITLKYFLKFIFNIGFKDEEIQSNGWLFLIFIFSKILIGFGVYQTIQAFRKYGK